MLLPESFKKLCDQCQTWLPANCFYKNKNKSDGLQGKCIDCIKDYKISLKYGKPEQIISIQQGSYFIPNIYLVGFGRTQTYQNACLSCDKYFFCLQNIRNYEDLFCEKCSDVDFNVPEQNKSLINYIGNVVGWIVKIESPSKIRNFRNYKKVYERDKYTCQYCGFNFENAKYFQPLHIDHIKPWSAQGGNSMYNLVVSCQECNLIAHNKWFKDFLDKKEFILRERTKRKKNGMDSAL